MDEQPPSYPSKPVLGVERIERALRLRKALEDQPRRELFEADRRAVAEALYRLLQRLEDEHDIAKAKVLRAAGIGDEGDSTKHLSQYAIRPGASPGRLRKKVGVYVKLTKETAKLAGLDETEVLLEVFSQAGFWQTAATRQAAAEFVELAEQLRFVMDAVAREQHLTKLFQDVEKGGGVLTPRLDCWRSEQETGGLLTPQEVAVEFDAGYGSQLWPIEFYQPTAEAEDPGGDCIPAYPSLVLGAWRLDSPFPARITAEMMGADASVHAISGTVDGQYAIEMRLCIVPTGKAMEATPALRVQLSATLSPLLAPSVGAALSPPDAAAILTFHG